MIAATRKKGQSIKNIKKICRFDKKSFLNENPIQVHYKYSRFLHS